MSNILVTGGAGFIGSHLVDALLEKGHKVRVFDSLVPQVHGGLRERGEWPAYLATDCERIVGDVRDRDALWRAICGIDIIFHEAALVGVNQSMTEIERYVDVNSRGTAQLLDLLVNGIHHIRRLIVASSMSIYGEGTYHCPFDGDIYPRSRALGRLIEGKWDLDCPICGGQVEPRPTDENKPLYPSSIYAITKRDQEEMCLTVGRAYGIPTIALRYFNVYGPRQSLKNPYSGVVAIFAKCLLDEVPPSIHEDGLQSRDFVYISDVVQANLLALEQEKVDYGVFNVASGRPSTILDVAEMLGLHIERRDQLLECLYTFRVGDIRHCISDIRKLKNMGYRPQVFLHEGVKKLMEWINRERH